MDSRTPIDIAAGAIAAASIVEILPAITSALTIIWMGLRIYQAVKEIKNKSKDN